ncbi:M56 family metallopeptidase [Hymenobacter humi]|uniref:M56 family metallopeptidase n=1 Tax=Hymenobacter humi TaxID=1411620 RepID=A0ABW2U0K9_9BACT
MSPILLYLMKANGALLLFALAYFGLLRRLTFFSLNRFYLLFALLFSAVYPALPMPALFPAEAALPGAFVLVETTAAQSAVVASSVAPAVDWEAVGLVLYAGGAAVLLARLLVQLLSLWLRRSSRPSTVLGQPIRALAGAVSPFSFWRTIYLNPLQHPGAELAAVLHHEQVHVRQWHTLDVLLAQVALALAWLNPAAWLLRRALLNNLEYLADHAALQTGLDRQAYQYSLLRLSQGVAGPSLVSHFTFPTLKNRVAMMNTPHSSAGQAGPLLCGRTAGAGSGAGLLGRASAGAGPTTPAKLTPAEAQPTTISSPQAAVEMKTAAEPAPRPRPAAKRAKVSVQVPAAASRPEAAESTPKAVNATKQSGPPPLYYVDGKLSSNAQNTLDPKSIASISVFKGEQARPFGDEASAAGVVVVTTKQNENNPEVLAFNQKYGVQAAVPAAPAKTETPYLAAPALAYITKTYPDARLLGVTQIQGADGTPQYQAEIAIGRRPAYLVFDAKGQFISESQKAR